MQPDSEPLEATFELNDTLYAKANIPYSDEVYLWLGANVMLAYPIDEAVTLLESKLKAAQDNLANCEEDLDFLREQITVRLPSELPSAMEVGEYLLLTQTDSGSCNRKSLQLGCVDEEERERRGRSGGRRQQGEVTKRLI